jgi:DNA-binding winged helix-turn-helix (wHTH) protein
MIIPGENWNAPRRLSREPGGLIAASVRRLPARYRASRVCRRGEHIALEPQVFDLPVFLLQNRERVVSKDDLLASVWGGGIVSNATLDSRIAAARRVVGDRSGAQTLIRTFAPQGGALRRRGA